MIGTMSGSSSRESIEVLAKKWLHQLRQRQYAGELAIAEEELPDLARKIRRDLFSVRRSSHTATCMLVLAINCMYYRHDEQGLPPSNALAEKLKVNFNTVTKAYRDLEVMGLLYTRRGMGVFIQEGAQQKCRQAVFKEIAARIHEVVAEA